MIPIDKVRPESRSAAQGASAIVRELADSIREKGVLEPLLVRYVPREDTYYIISGERRYHASTRSRPARASLHRENRRRRGNPGTCADRKSSAQRPDRRSKKPTACSAWPIISITRTTTSRRKSDAPARRSPKPFAARDSRTGAQGMRREGNRLQIAACFRLRGSPMRKRCAKWFIASRRVD